jgi:hypothetical protein
MFQVTSRTVVMTWDPAVRLARIHFERETRATGEDAAVLVAALSRWIGGERQPFALLGDGKGLASVDAEYRARWGRFFREHRKHCSIAFFNMGPLVRLAAEMFRVGTGIPLKAFECQASARSWLQERGIDA